MKGSILIVDDEATLAEAVRDHFAAQGFEATSAPSAEAALSLARLRRFDVVITDLKLPGMDGLGLLRALGELAEPPSAVLATAYGTMEAAVEAFRLGLFDLLQKPISLDELTRSVERAMAARASRRRRVASGLPLRLLRERSRCLGPMRAEVAGDPSAADATAVWCPRALDRERTGFVWAHVLPGKASTPPARLIIRTLADVVNLSQPVSAVETIVDKLTNLDCGAALRAIAVGVLEAGPVRRVRGAVLGSAGVFHLDAGGSGVLSLADGTHEAARAWEAARGPDDVLVLADPRLITAAGHAWPEVLGSLPRLIAEGEPNPARRALAMLSAAGAEAPVVVALRIGEAIRPDGPTHVRASSSWASLGHLRSVAEQFALGSPLTDRAAHQLVSAVQEAVLNGIRWAYPDREGPMYMTLAREGSCVKVSVRDRGVGFDVSETWRRSAGEPQDPLRRSGRGLALMRRLADRFEVVSRPGRGTNVVLEKHFDAPAAGVGTGRGAESPQ
jgi:FixJ family two-component response regulator/anti-sigma regulatory factor (Ser/Thr protein kinase)